LERDKFAQFKKKKFELN